MTARNHYSPHPESTRSPSSRRGAIAPTWISIPATILIGLATAIVAAEEVVTNDQATLTSAEARQPAVGFIVQTDVFVQSDRRARQDARNRATPNDQRVARNATYFLKDRIVDVAINESGTIESAVILELVSGNITLLDSGRAKQCSLTYDELLQTVAAVTSRLEDKPPIVKFAANPLFKVDWNEDSGKLGMIGAPMGYLIHTTRQPTRNSASLYRRFADMSARLNATQPSGLPPAARLEINREVGNHNAVPTRVERTRIDNPQKMYSTHQYRLNLDSAATANIATVDLWSKEFESTDLVSYRLGK